MNNSSADEENRCRCKNCNIVFPSRNKLFKHITHCPDPETVKLQNKQKKEFARRSIEEDKIKQLDYLNKINVIYQQILSGCQNSDDIRDLYEYLEFFDEDPYNAIESIKHHL